MKTKQISKKNSKFNWKINKNKKRYVHIIYDHKIQIMLILSFILAIFLIPYVIPATINEIVNNPLLIHSFKNEQRLQLIKENIQLTTKIRDININGSIKKELRKELTKGKGFGLNFLEIPFNVNISASEFLNNNPTIGSIYYTNPETGKLTYYLKYRKGYGVDFNITPGIIYTIYTNSSINLTFIEQ